MIVGYAYSPVHLAQFAEEKQKRVERYKDGFGDGASNRPPFNADYSDDRDYQQGYRHGAHAMNAHVEQKRSTVNEARDE